MQTNEDEDDDGRPSYEVEFILGKRGEGPDKEYLVKWKGCPEEAATWEPESNLENCAAMLRAIRAGLKNVNVGRRPQPSPPLLNNPFLLGRLVRP